MNLMVCFIIFIDLLHLPHKRVHGFGELPMCVEVSVVLILYICALFFPLKSELSYMPRSFVKRAALRLFPSLTVCVWLLCVVVIVEKLPLKQFQLVGL